MNQRDKRRKFGQNYLKDPAILFEIEQSISPQPNDKFFEIGPGMGALTSILNKENISITAIDIDEFNIDEQFPDNNSNEQSSEQVVKKDIDNLDLDYKVFTTKYDEITKAEKLENVDEAIKLRKNWDGNQGQIFDKVLN